MYFFKGIACLDFYAKTIFGSVALRTNELPEPFFLMLQLDSIELFRFFYSDVDITATKCV